MKKFNVAWITLLILTLAMIGAMMYCEGYVGWVESHGQQDDIFIDFPPTLPHHNFLYKAWMGFALLSVLWTVFGFLSLIFTKEPKFKTAPIVPIVASLAYLSVETYYRHSGVAIENPVLTFTYIRLGFLALVALWIALGVVWLKAGKVKPGLTASEACHSLALIEGQKEIARRLKAVRKMKLNRRFRK